MTLQLLVEKQRRSSPNSYIRNRGGGGAMAHDPQRAMAPAPGAMVAVTREARERQREPRRWTRTDAASVSPTAAIRHNSVLNSSPSTVPPLPASTPPIDATSSCELAPSKGPWSNFNKLEQAMGGWKQCRATRLS